MRVHGRPIPALLGLAAALSTVLLLAVAASAQTVPAPILDHFKCYFAHQDPPTIEPARLEDQFDAAAGIVEQVRVVMAVRFCNPVQKTKGGQVTPIANPDHHLTLHIIVPGAPTPSRLVMVKNQFGSKRLKVFDPEVLAVPTQKLPHDPPKGLDHFKCYRVYGSAINVPVTLRDQFLLEPRVKVLEPVGLCNPVEKTHGTVVTPIVNPRAHLVCYKITSKEFTRTLEIENQFGRQKLVLRDADLLCVPSEKRVL
jgi:hypothetical protein